MSQLKLLQLHVFCNTLLVTDRANVYLCCECGRGEQAELLYQMFLTVVV